MSCEERVFVRNILSSLKYSLNEGHMRKVRKLLNETYDYWHWYSIKHNLDDTDFALRKIILWKMTEL